MPAFISKLVAEFFGTFWLTFGGCGSAVLAALFIAQEGATPINLGIGLVGVSFAFGLTVLTMAYAIGHVSGCHLNPAVSVGLCVAGRFGAASLVPYIISQVLGALAGPVCFISSHQERLDSPSMQPKLVHLRRTASVNSPLAGLT